MRNTHEGIIAAAYAVGIVEGAAVCQLLVVALAHAHTLKLASLCVQLTSHGDKQLTDL